MKEVSVIAVDLAKNVFQLHGSAADGSAVVCGPGDIAQAHQAGECLSGAQRAAGRAFMERVVRSLRA